MANQLFSPYTIKDVTLKNRIVMSPMCMYSAKNQDGKLTPWHFTHYISRAVGQVGLLMIEASAVTPQGRISAEDLGIWSDEHIEGFKQLVEQIHEQGSKAAIQIAHAGRKATVAGPIIAPSAIAYNGKMRTPEEMTTAQIKETIKAFADGARRAKQAGFDIIEIHGAHGYLISEFLSPLTNQREDEYGGNERNRYRFLEETIEAVKQEWDGPLFVRISASEYHENGTPLETFVEYAKQMKEQGVDLIDCSSGGVVPVRIEPYPGYQVRFAETIKHQAAIASGAVGLITTGIQAQEILQNERADLVFLARELLRDPYWPRTAAIELGVELPAPTQYERGW
ncbi:NADPH dehydrogenase NamA [Desertibacillus haloalkaliphilus]|uniref:NADPH dehydrogenase NamA n=1 Tax=Desertibacillus haloalkaliphilus TaxID=1328930 RepID=UPI001C273ACB|nr:NADPH dehydrogenase NamA [Desertibacillus haloalkaliphilus]MBU8907784.1 NADPH dehydrogenase NamA [Desertibacillus haloalkaliphilus]